MRNLFLLIIVTITTACGPTERASQQSPKPTDCPELAACLAKLAGGPFTKQIEYLETGRLAAACTEILAERQALVCHFKE